MWTRTRPSERDLTTLNTQSFEGPCCGNGLNCILLNPLSNLFFVPEKTCWVSPSPGSDVTYWVAVSHTYQPNGTFPRTKLSGQLRNLLLRHIYKCVNHYHLFLACRTTSGTVGPTQTVSTTPEGSCVCTTHEWFSGVQLCPPGICLRISSSRRDMVE